VLQENRLHFPTGAVVRIFSFLQHVQIASADHPVDTVGKAAEA
jgi:hypothetical protein